MRCVLLAALLLQLACAPDQVAHGSVVVRGPTMRALAGADLVSVHGTYGAGCTSRSGAWSIAVNTPSPLDPPNLTVLMSDSTCALTLTALRTTLGLIAAAPAILLTTSYEASPSAFAMPVAFYANARLSATDFADDFELTVSYASDLTLGTRDHYAQAIPPTVVDETPEAGATGRSINTRPTATFDTEMDAASLTDLTFTLHEGLTPVSGAVSFDAPSNRAIFEPSAVLALNVTYTATVTVGAKDVGGTPLAANHVWTFTTALSSQAPIALRTAWSFAVLAEAAVTNTGTSAITGDVGSNTSLTGLTPSMVLGTQHSADAAAAQGVSDVGLAYADALGRALDPIITDGNIGGSVLLPGLYRSASSLEVTSGDLTLDADGDVDAIFIFQIGSTFDMSAGRQIFLAGGAQDTNVYWQVGSSATLGTGAVLHGTILADQSITLTNGARVYGRALARAASVTMDTNTVTRPVR